MSEYRDQARKFCFDTGTEITFNFVECVLSCPWDKLNPHNKYNVTIKRNGKFRRFTFYDSIRNTRTGETPDAYDILACITKSDPGEFEDFVFDYGYGDELTTREGFRKVKKTYEDVVREWKKVNDLFSDVLDELQEIC